MKRQFTYLILTAGLSAMLGSLAFSAQDEIETANIPFAFQANDTTFAAGNYRVSRDFNSGLIQMRDADTGHAIFVKTHPTDTSKVNKPRLTFACYGEQCALSSIWMSNNAGYGVYGPSHDNLTRKIGVAANVRSVRLTAQ